MGLSATRLLGFSLWFGLIFFGPSAGVRAQETRASSFCERGALIFDDTHLFNIDKWPADKQRFEGQRDVALPPALQGDELEFNTTVPVVVAKGNVWFHYEHNTVTADELSLDRTGGVITARGNVRVSDADGKATYADRMELTSDLRDVFERLVSCPAPSFKLIRGMPPQSLHR